MEDGINVHLVANAAEGKGLSGADRIFIELARRWAEYDSVLSVTVYVCEEGLEMCRRNGLEHVSYVTTKALSYRKLGFSIYYLARTLKGCISALKTRFGSSANNLNIVYAASDFWPDYLPAHIINRRIKGSKLIGSLYLFAPIPFSKESPYRNLGAIKGALYYLMQRPIYWIIKRHADMIFVTSQPDVQKFVTKKRGKEKIVAVRGGVDTKLPQQVPEPKSKKYDAVFLGRFHPQKGVLELIDIWGLVCNVMKNAKLVLIGIGELEDEIRDRIRDQSLKNNVDLVGFKDGVEKIKIFKSSKIVLHPAIYDSGGMAACEAMAAGLPGVSFDLPALETYYPKGMIKTPCFDLKAFAENILLLLNDKSQYEKIRRDALRLAEEWDWDKRASEIFEKIKLLFA